MWQSLIKTDRVFFSFAGLVLFACSWLPSIFFLLILSLSYYALHGMLTERRLRDKIFLGRVDHQPNKRDILIVFCQVTVIASYAYLLACQRVFVISYILILIAISVVIKNRLSDQFAQRKFFYRTSIFLGCGYSVLLIAVTESSFLSGIYALGTKLFHATSDLCGIFTILTTLRGFSASFIQLLPFPFDWLLAPLNFNLLYGPLVAAGVLGIVKVRIAFKTY